MFVRPSLRFSLFLIFFQKGMVAKKSLEKYLKLKKIGAQKEAIGAHKEAMVAKKSLK